MPRQSADWLAMTALFCKLSKNYSCLFKPIIIIPVYQTERTSIRDKPRMCTLRDQIPREPECPGRFASLRFAQGTVSLVLLCGYPLMATGVTTKVTPVAYFTVLRTTPESAAFIRQLTASVVYTAVVVLAFLLV